MFIKQKKTVQRTFPGYTDIVTPLGREEEEQEEPVRKRRRIL